MLIERIHSRKCKGKFYRINKNKSKKKIVSGQENENWFVESIQQDFLQDV